MTELKMTSEDCRELTEAMGECWHDYNLSHDGLGLSSCSCGLRGCYVWDVCTKANRTFTTPDDWEAVKKALIAGRELEFDEFLWQALWGPKKSKIPEPDLTWWLKQTYEAQCKLALMWQREGGK